jgi:hypothetical protein
MTGQDPLPEPIFTWRRWVTIGVLIAVHILVAWVIFKLVEARPLMWVALALLFESVVYALLYMGGASAADLARIVQSAAVIRSGQAAAKDPETPEP